MKEKLYLLVLEIMIGFIKYLLEPDNTNQLAVIGRNFNQTELRQQLTACLQSD